MKIDNQVISLELAKRLQKLDVKQSSLFYWVSKRNKDIQVFGLGYIDMMDDIVEDELADYEYYAAFTVAELGYMLPSWINAHHLVIAKSATWFLRYRSPSSFIPPDDQPEIEEEKEADARAKMLIYLLENKLMELPK